MTQETRVKFYEPWYKQSFMRPIGGECSDVECVCLIKSSQAHPFPSWVVEVADCHRQDAIGDRIVSCVNACAGIDDPATLRQQNEKMRKALNRVIREMVSGPCVTAAAVLECTEALK